MCAQPMPCPCPLPRQVVRKALDEGYDVRCLVRPRMNPADFLRDWGATTVQVRCAATAATLPDAAACLPLRRCLDLPVLRQPT